MEEIKNVNITLIDRPENPMRQFFNEDDITTLAGSIAANGFISPLTIRRVGERYEVIDGDSRLEAAHRLRLCEVPCVVRDATDSETLVLRVLANLDRSNPDVVSEAVCYANAINKGVITIEALAEKLNRSISWIEDRLMIAAMPENYKAALRAKAVPLGVALELCQIDHERTRDQWLDAAIRDGMSVAGARNALAEFQKYKYIWDQQNAPESERVVPTAPPVLLFECVACGGKDTIEALQFVRIHKKPCLVEPNVPTA